MTSNILANNTDLDSLLALFVSGQDTAAATDYEVGGTDINSRYAMAKYGTAYGTTGYTVSNGNYPANTDIGNIFAKAGSLLTWVAITASSGNWTVPSGVTTLKEVIIIGSGGNGALDVATGGGGGGGGGVSIFQNMVVTPGASLPYNLNTSGIAYLEINSVDYYANCGTTASGITGGTGGVANSGQTYLIASYKGGDGANGSGANIGGGGGGGAASSGGSGVSASGTSGGAGGNGYGGAGGTIGNNGGNGTEIASGYGSGGGGGSVNSAGVGGAGGLCGGGGGGGFGTGSTGTYGGAGALGIILIGY